MSELKALVTDLFFDLDHTLWDFETNSYLTFKKVFLEREVAVDLDLFVMHYKPINHAYWKLYRENKISKERLRYQRLAETFQKLNFSIGDSQINEIAVAYIDHLSSFTHLFEGGLEVLNKLSPHYNLHVITNGFEKVQHYKIKNSGLAPFFDSIFTAEGVGVKKPHPEIFKTALKQTHTNPEQALMIGDSLEADILGALNQGMHAIHFNSQNEAPHTLCPIINSLEELTKLL